MPSGSTFSDLEFLRRGARQVTMRGEVTVFGTAKRVCVTCGTLAVPEKKTKGSVFVGLVLTCCFFLPGLIYFAWKMTSGYEACRKCGGRMLVPPDSPEGKRLMGR
jgi:hypothetical protein